MFYISKSDYNRRMNKIKKQNESYLRKQDLEKAKVYRKGKVTTTKLVMLYLFIVLNIVLIYSLMAMWHFKDLTHLGVLITSIVGQVVVFLVYAVKSAKENCKGGIKFETTMANLNFEDDSTLQDIETEGDQL